MPSFQSESLWQVQTMEMATATAVKMLVMVIKTKLARSTSRKINQKRETTKERLYRNIVLKRLKSNYYRTSLRFVSAVPLPSGLG